MTALATLAEAAGLQVDWTDASGQRRRVTDRALAGVLAALGLPAGSKAAIAASRRQLDRNATADVTFLAVDAGRPFDMPGASGPALLVLEDGTRRDITLGPAGRLPAIDTVGYHRLLVADREIGLAVAPQRCFGVADAAPGRRLWGPAVQIPALRDARGGAFGDFAALADAAAAFAARGADALAISPVHALFPADPGRYSPYAPSSRLFLNILYADPGPVDGAMPAPDLIDWAGAIPARLKALRAAYAARGDTVRAAVAAFARAGGPALEDHARFDALHAHFFASGARGWQDWPPEYHDAHGPAVAAFAAAHADEVEFYRFVQYLADRGLAAAQAAAKSAGMAIGLIADLAVGTDAGGSHAWSRPDDLLPGVSIGAPPDLLGPDGQNWGIAGFAPQALRRSGFEPFIATLRAALAHAGGIRIDHAMGLARLWIVPNGASAADGAYLTYPLADQLRLLALESHRARAIVIGEDLGTVPEGFRPALDAKGVLGMRVLWFERDDDGRFTPPARWSTDAAAMTGTHDLATVAGWWSARDLDWNEQLGRGATDPAAERRRRSADRAQLWHAFTAAGITAAPPPASADAASVADAALAFVGGTPSALTIVPVEDIAGLVEQPNLPGTTVEHPNWRRRLPAPTADLLAEPAVAARLTTLDALRKS